MKPRAHAPVRAFECARCRFRWMNVLDPGGCPYCGSMAQAPAKVVDWHEYLFLEVKDNDQSEQFFYMKDAFNG